MKTKKIIKSLSFISLLLISNLIYSQTTISGSVVDSETGEAIPGANVIEIRSKTREATKFNENNT